MPRSRKTNRVPQNSSYAGSNLSTTADESTIRRPHLREISSVSSPPPLRDSSNPAIPPHLRGLTTPTASEPAAKKPDEPVNPKRAFPCTFADCEEAFPTEALLLKHKASPMSGHDFCKLCKLDFEDDAAFHLHKMESEAHITCSICSEDFKSEGGLKRHGLQASSK